MTLAHLEEAVRSELVADVQGMLSWLDDEYDQDIPTDPETAEAVVEVAMAPELVVASPAYETSESAPEVVKNSTLIRATVARDFISNWAQMLAAQVIPLDRSGSGGPHRPGGPP